MCKRAKKADGGFDYCLIGSWRRRRLGRSGCLVGSWRGRGLGHAKAIRVQTRPALPEAAARVKRR
jgi:hypothetical protein